MNALSGRPAAVLKQVGGILVAALIGTLAGSLTGFAIDLYQSTQSVDLTTDTPWTVEGAPVGAVAGVLGYVAWRFRPRRKRN
jgi:membrane protein implicated in regulation of membrane protease activity